jgi:hypothetical protein
MSSFPQFVDFWLTHSSEVASLVCWQPFTPRKISVKGWVAPRAIVQLEGLGQLRNPVTSLGIEPVTSQLVAQYPSQVCCHVPRYDMLCISLEDQSWNQDEDIVSLFISWTCHPEVLEDRGSQSLRFYCVFTRSRPQTYHISYLIQPSWDYLRKRLIIIHKLKLLARKKAAFWTECV